MIIIIIFIICINNIYSHVEEHQWPPIKYLKELEEYEKAIGKSDSNCNIM